MDIIKIWHYFPDLLKSYSDKKTNYSLLCEAREIIFKDYYTDFSYPAATVIGIEGDKILIYFLAASCKKYDVIENKRQVSSYDYPQNIFFEKPIEVIVKLNLLEKTVSPPHSIKLYFFCSLFNDLETLAKFDCENVLLLPDPDIK